MDIDGRASCPNQMQLFPRCAAHPSKGLGGKLGCGDLERSRVEFLGSDPLLTFIVADLPNLQCGQTQSLAHHHTSQGTDMSELS